MMLKPKEKPKSSVIPNYNVCDIETNPDGSLLAGGFLYYENDIFSNDTAKYLLFHDWGEFISFVSEKAISNKSIRTIYAHHGANFDWLSLTEFLLDNKLISSCKIITADTLGIGMNISLGDKRGNIYLRDSARLLPAKLDDLCKTFKTTHRKLNIGDKLPHEILKENPALFYSYLENDCRSLSDVLRSFHQLINEHIGIIEKLPMTLASLSMLLYRTYFLDKPILTTWNNKQKEFFRRAYTGGRTEVLHPGEFTGVNGYDINSLYPFVMRSCEVPASYRSLRTKRFRENPGIFEIRFNQTDRKIPPILRDENNQETQYKGTGVFCSPEIHNFLRYGEIEIIDGFIFRHTEVLFKNFVTTLYALRLEAQANENEALSYTIKICMNSLYGKFGERPEREVMVKTTKELLQSKKKMICYGDLTGVFETKSKEHEFVAVAAFITSNARLALWNLIEHAGKDAIYCDTDSIYMTGELPNTMISKELGMLKKEFTGSGTFIGRKLFALKDLNNKEKIRAKGVRLKGRNGALLSYNDMLIMMHGFEMRRYYQSANTLRQVLTQGKDACRFETRHRTLRATACSIWQNIDLRNSEHDN